MEPNDPQATLFRDFERLFQRSVEINTRLLQQAGTFYSRLLAGEWSAPDPRWQAGMVDAWSDWLRLQLRYAEGLLAWSEQLIVRLGDGQTTAPRPDAPPPPHHPPPPPRQTMRLSGKAGETIASSIRLQNSNQQARDTRLQAPPFAALEPVESGHAAFSPVFEPASFTLAPGQEMTVKISIALPAGLPAGHYRTTITILGFEDSYFDLDVEVAAGEGRTLAPGAERKTTSRSTGKGRKKRNNGA